jgi:hypothetical protein
MLKNVFYLFWDFRVSTVGVYSPLLKGILNLFIYSNCILHPYGSSNYNTKACKHIKEKQHKHNKYVNVGEIFDRRGPYTQGLTINV